MKTIQHAIVFIASMFFISTSFAAAPVRSVPSCTKQPVSNTIEVKAGETYDGLAKFGKWMCFIGSTSSMNGGQSESQKPIFKLNNGATLKNVIIGDGSVSSTSTSALAGGGDGVHCYGKCSINNVYWADVGEDAATLHTLTGTTGSLKISGGAAFKAKDKVFQHNANGTVSISDFYANNIGKLYRSCGNCSKQFARTVNVTGVRLGTVNSSVVGVNSSYDSKSGIAGQYDKATISDLVYSGSKTKCDTYVGTGSGNEPVKDTNSSNIARSCIFK
ncbi:MAG: pectate lyase [Spongiibacteraceae bacterium]